MTDERLAQLMNIAKHPMGVASSRVLAECIDYIVELRALERVARVVVKEKRAINFAIAHGTMPSLEPLTKADEALATAIDNIDARISQKGK